MRYQVNCCNSNLTYDIERPRLIAYLDTMEGVSARYDDKCVDDAFIVEVSRFNTNADKVRKILFKLANRGCWVFSYSECETLWRKTTVRAIERYRRQLTKTYLHQ